MLQGWGGMVLADMPTWLQYRSKQCPLDKKYHASRVGGWFLGASRHAHLITVSFKTEPIRQEVSCYKGGGGMVLADMPTWLQYLPVFYQCFNSVSSVFHQSFTSVSPLFNQSLTVFNKCLKSVLPVFQNCIKSVSKIFQNCSKQKYFKSVPNLFVCI